MIEAIVTRHANAALAPSCALLRAAIAGPFAAEPRRLAAAAHGLMAALPGDIAILKRTTARGVDSKN